MAWKFNPFTNSLDYYAAGGGSGGDPLTLTHVANFSALPDPTTVSLYDVYVVDNSQGNRFWYGSIGGTYYPAGAYYSDLTKWVYSESASKATQAEVNTGTDTEKYLTPETFTAASKWGGYVPYTGATSNVNLGAYDITASHLIKNGGISSQFLKADGSVDNNIYLTSANLPSTLDLFATTTTSDVPGYVVLVRNILDPRFNTVAVDVPTGVITTTNQLLASLITDTNIISGNPGIFNFTTIGNITRLSGTGQADFFFRIYKRDSLGVETLITQSANTIPVTNGGYTEFSAVALWNDGIFLSTDRIVLKFYANRLVSPVGSDPEYQFQFGGMSPVRSAAAIPVSVLPNIYLSNLVDVEDVTPLNNEVLYWNTTANLWEHSLVKDLLGYTPLKGGTEFIFVYVLADLPTPSSGIITLGNNVTYFFTTTVDLVGNRLVCGINTTILGASSENCAVISTGLNASTALVTSVHSLPVRNISFTHGTVFDLSGDGVTTALDWFGVNLLNCASGGTIKNYTNFVAGDSALLNSGGFIFDGTFGTSAFSNCLFDTAAGTTAITILPTCTISRRLRIIYSSFVTLSGETSINFSASATVNDEKYILDTCNFSGGATYLAGINHTSNKALFANCVGIPNTSTKGLLYMINNTTDTTIGVPNVNVWVKALGTTTSGSLSKFSHTNNRLTYTGAFSQSFMVNVNASVRSAGTNQVISIGVAKNGNILTETEMTIRTTTANQEYPGGTLAVVDMVATDFIELFVKNTSSTDIRVSDLNMNIVKIPV